MAFALEERDLEEPLCVDLEQVERREDLTAAELSRIGIAGVIDLEIALVFPVVDEDAVEGRGLAPCHRDDGLVELTGTVHGALIAEEMRLAVADPDEHPGTRPGRLQDVAG